MLKKASGWVLKITPDDAEYTVATFAAFPPKSVLSDNAFSGYYIPTDLIDELFMTHSAYDEKSGYSYVFERIDVYI